MDGDAHPTLDELAGCLTATEAAKVLRITTGTLRGWILRGVLAPVWDVGTAARPDYRIPEKVVLERFRLVEPFRLG